eukprot:385832-Pyramimonas_sp.AAC.1
MGASWIAVTPSEGVNGAERPDQGMPPKLPGASARCPLSALWLALKRVCWDVASSAVVADDLGVAYGLLRVCPGELKCH